MCPRCTIDFIADMSDIDGNTHFLFPTGYGTSFHISYVMCIETYI